MTPGMKVRLDLSKRSGRWCGELVQPVMDLDGAVLTLARRIYVSHVRILAWHVEESMYWFPDEWLAPLTDAEVGKELCEPRNNDGRALCWWCSGVPTEKRGGGAYDLCPDCGR
jgi:hypothetical protein